MDLKKLEVWFLTGSQHLYGPETLAKVAEHSQEIAQFLDDVHQIPVSIKYVPILKSAEEIYDIIHKVNVSENCIGIITWMHTFSPSKMWIRGLNQLQKPMLHLHTQYNRDIPWDNIDMDFMNLNQSAHGDREFGFMVSRMRIKRKVVVGFWKDEDVLASINIWCRAAAAWHDWQGAKFARIGDNMRYVAVTEGDKVEAEMKFGFSVNTYGVGDLVAVINSIDESQIHSLLKEYEDSYDLADHLKEGGAKRDSLVEAARIELGLKSFLEKGGFKGFTDTFEDLHGMVQLPGIAAQRLMQQGYGFAGEGDWKTAALVRACKIMGTGLAGGNAFMEDYTYHLDPANPMVLGAHMLEIDASLAKGKAKCEVHPLGIGGKAEPVRLVFNVAGGNAINASLIDLGNRFRLLLNEVEAVEPAHDLPKLPVARVLWKPLPDLKTACTAWIYAGGAHHTVFSQNLSSEYFKDFAKMADIELVSINHQTNLDTFEKELMWSEMCYK